MKHTPESAWAFVQNPDTGLVSALVYGADPVLVRHCRKALANGLSGEGETGLALVDTAAAARSPDAIRNELSQRDIFGASQVTALDGATDRHTSGISEALKDAKAEDSFLLVTAGDLRPTSTLRQLYEKARKAAALPVAAPKWEASDIRQRFVKASLPAPHPEASAMLASLSRELDWGTFNLLLEKLELYQQGRSEELTVEDIDACAPVTALDDADELVDAVATQQYAKVAACWRRQTGRGATPTGLVGAVLRHFVQARMVTARARSAKDIEYVARGRRLHPLRRPAVVRDARRWRTERLERAIAYLLETDAGLRGGSNVPPSVLGERSLLKVTSWAPRSGASKQGG